MAKASIKSNAAKLAADQFNKDRAEIVTTLNGILDGRLRFRELMQTYSGDAIRFALIRLDIMEDAMMKYVAAKADQFPKVDKAYIHKLASWDATKDGDFPADMKLVREAGYNRWKYAKNVADVKANVHAAGAKHKGGKNRVEAAAQNRTAAKAQAATAADAATQQAQAAVSNAADAIKARSVETFPDLSGLSLAYANDCAHIVKLQAANAKRYSAAMLTAHEAAVAALKHFVLICK